MIKDTLVTLLDIIEKEFKRNCEQNSDEIERDKWGVYHEQILIIKNTIKNGGIK